MLITEDHIKLLKRMDFDWDDECEFGGVASDFKRPFGNSGVPQDVDEILGRPEETTTWDEAKQLSIPLAAIVNHVLRNADLDALVGQDLKLPWRAGRMVAA